MGVYVWLNACGEKLGVVDVTVRGWIIVFRAQLEPALVQTTWKLPPEEKES